ncbi:hypothetical protein JQ604_10740 [Bradyrhizobium jicamae]|uniref:hypothetical protein n=1 Tax=Bradyrhizobium jicamae TaxID=280332 RepID=UPI001BA8B1CD|nr:hypothetical protein [Bradyrhizobium jicamae]MBR0752661.1 hypothetical protein [Bradyrhizobium jicamae]
MTNDTRELSIEQLDQTSGGSMMDIVIKAYEKYMADLGAKLINDLHKPLVPKTGLGFPPR